MKTTIETPLGPFTVHMNETGAITAASFDSNQATSEHEAQDEGVQTVRQQVTEFFEKSRQEFDLPLAPEGTPFQQKVWHALTEIPYGKTCSYGDLAKRLGDPNAVRAVGRANGANPIALIIPCHRVIGADNSLTGYAGGLELKRKLLEFEGTLLQASLDF